MKGVALAALDILREQELAAVIESREADFNDHRVTHSAKTANALARFLLLEELCAAAVEFSDKPEGRPAGRKGGTPSRNDSLDL